MSTPEATSETPSAPVAEPGLSRAEREKMDYQAKLDREKITPRNGARWRELAWDKGFFGALTAIVAFAAVMLANSWSDRHRREEARELERYKLAESRSRYFMEKRLDAIQNNAAAMSAVTRCYFNNVVDGKVTGPDVANSECRAAIEKAREVLNRCESLFGRNVNTDMTRYFELWRAISRIGIEKCVEYRD